MSPNRTRPDMKRSTPAAQQEKRGLTRRSFIKTGAAAMVFTAASRSRVFGANERVRVGLIDAKLMRDVPNVEFATVCDLYPQHLARAKEWAGTTAKEYKDFRRLLEQKDVDAVLIATPDHWHAIPTVLACQAGKDVYVEKPLSHNVREGRAMIETARRHNRIVQVGTQ